GGIASATDALEFMIAGANAVQIGTANFMEPFLWGPVIDGISAYLDRHGMSSVDDLVGSVVTQKATATT
ncbi:MAG: dihydroorotate dehydrogenase, partial [Acidobacteriota bacterium]|nr:dihydroorotate dehydrogenase [Acidobacteriota bacterium]